jgi:hypothetical protein
MVEDGIGRRGGLDAGGGGEDVADGDGVVCGRLSAVPGVADEGGRAPVRRHVEELEHRLKHVVEDLVYGRRRGRRRMGLVLHLRALRRWLVLILCPNVALSHRIDAIPPPLDARRGRRRVVLFLQPFQWVPRAKEEGWC